MNRTTAFLGLATALLLTAVVVGLPRTPPAPSPRPDTPAPVPAPSPPPPLTATPAPTPVAGSLTLEGRLSHPFIPVGHSDVFATLDITGVQVPGARRAPVNLAVVIDRSGSMLGTKIESARAAALRLVDLLDEGDRLAVIHYGTDVNVLPGALATDAQKARMRRFIQGMEAMGGTNIGDGLAAGRAQLDAAKGEFRVNRLILLSDGQPTVGLTEPGSLIRLAATLRAGGVTVTSLGVGADFNENLMARLAQVGGGSYGFVQSPASMATLFEKDLTQAGTLVASAVSVSFAVPEGVTFRQVYGRPVTQAGRQVTVALPDFSSLQHEQVVVHFSVDASRAGTPLALGDFRLTYRDLLAGQAGASAAVALSAMTTTDTVAVRERRDKTAFVTATRAQAAANYQRAAEALEQGDVAHAKDTIRANEALYHEAEQLAGPAAVQPDRAANDELFGLTSSSGRSEEAQKTQVKALKVQSLRGSGLGSSLY